MEWKKWLEMTEQERREDREKMRAAAKAFTEKYGKETWVTITDPDGAVHSLPESLYRQNVLKQGEAEGRNKSSTGDSQSTL